MYTYIWDLLVLFRSHPLVHAPFAQTLKEVDREGRSGAGAVRAVRRARRRALKAFASAGEKTISWEVFLRRCFVAGIFFFSYQVSYYFPRNIGCFLLTRISLKMARLATTLGSLCRDRFGVHYHPSLSALRAAVHACTCRV